MKIKTAFVASTLPARFLLDNWPSLNISRLICGSESLRASFQFLKEKFPELELLSVSSSGEERSFSLLEEVENSKVSIVIFHECCWLELDNAILKVQPVVEYYPCVTLDSWRKLSNMELGFFRLLARFLIEKNKNIFKLVYLSLRYKKDFDFYEVVEDDGNKNKSYQTAFKESRVLRLQKSTTYLTSRQKLKRISLKTDSKNIVFIVGSDVVENSLQKEIFYKIAKICDKFGYGILLKDHPNPSSRLNITGVGRSLSPVIPFEVCEESYCIKIGLFSTALIFEPENSVSIADLFSPVPDAFVDRRKHLLSIPGGDQIRFVDNWAELEKILESHFSANPG